MPQGIYTFKSSKTGKTYRMPWNKPTPPGDEEVDAFVLSQETQAPKPTPAPAPSPLEPVKPVEQPNMKWGDYAAMGLRGASGLAVGSLPGAFASGLVELPAQLLEVGFGNRKYFDWKQVPIEAAIGAIPFGKAAKTLRTVKAVGKGALVAGGGEALREVVNEGEIDPTRVGLAAATGGAGAGVLDRVTRRAPKSASKPPIPEPIPVKPVDPNFNQGMGNPELAGSVPYKDPLLKKIKPVTTGPVPVAEIGTKPIETAEERIRKAIREAGPIRAAQEKMYSEERLKRIKSFEGMDVKTLEDAKKRMSVLGGKLPKADFASIKLDAGDVDSLFAKLHNSPDLTGWEKAHAHTGLSKLFGEFGGKVPQDSELELLSKVFDRNFIDELKSKIGRGRKAESLAFQILGLPRALMSGPDLSAFRQAFPLVGRKEYWKNAKDYIEAFSSEGGYEKVISSIRANPKFGMAQEMGLALTDLTSRREETIMSSLPEKLKLFGIKPYRASNRGYSAYLNKLRMDVFSAMADSAKKAGISDDKTLSSIASFVNNATGRGTLGKNFEKSVEFINQGLFSPRLVASRLQMLNPVKYATLDKISRKELLRSHLSMLGAGTAMLTLAKIMGAEVGEEPTSSDFGKIRVGDNVRADVWGSFQPYVRLGMQVATGKKTAITGREYDLRNPGFGGPTVTGQIGQFLENKEAPLLSFVLGSISGIGPDGRPFEYPKEIWNRVTPMILNDLIELKEEDPETFKYLPLGIPAALGVGVQRFENKPYGRSSGSGLRRVSEIR